MILAWLLLLLVGSCLAPPPAEELTDPLLGFDEINLSDDEADDPDWVFDQTSPDSAGARGAGKIRCIGEKPKWLFDAFPTMPALTTLHSVLEICATPPYGGRLQQRWGLDRFGGGFCGWYLDPPQFVFSRQLYEIWGTPTVPKEYLLWLYCQTKCSCAGTPPYDADQRAGVAYVRLLEPLRRGTQIGVHTHFVSTESNTGPPLSLSLRAFQSGNVPGTSQAIPLHNTVGDSIEMPGETNIYHVANTKKGVVRGVSANAIYCLSTPSPIFPIPGARRYASNHEICAANFLGGHPIANMGTVCVDPAKGRISTLDRYIHPDFVRGVFFPGAVEPVLRPGYAIALRLFCETHCACAQRSRLGRRHRPSSYVDGVGEVIFESNGDLKITQRTGSSDSWFGSGGGQSVKFLFRGDGYRLPSERRDYKCDIFSDGQEWCIRRPGKLPKEPRIYEWDVPRQKRSDSIRTSGSKPLTAEQQTCSLSCTKQADCSFSNECRCVVSQETIPRAQQYDPVSGVALQFGFVAACTMLSKNLGARLGGRSLDSSPLCVCNGTFASFSCC